MRFAENPRRERSRVSIVTIRVEYISLVPDIVSIERIFNSAATLDRVQLGWLGPSFNVQRPKLAAAWSSALSVW